MNRFLNRRDKDGSTHRRQKSRDKKIRPLSGDSIWGFFKTSSQKKQDQENTNVVASIRQKFLDAGHQSPADDLVNYALTSDYANGDPERAYDILILFQESVDGLIHPCDPTVNLVGAINRNNVTCYIDSVLFAMLGVVNSYDLIFCGAFENDAQRLLSRIVLLYANMLRAGKLIHPDLTKNLQEALAACGWDCDPSEQQDASEFYEFIARTLNVPLLSIESNIFHHATPDECHDHRIIEEQVLNVSIPDVDDGKILPLERCLEEFLNNKVEITRSLPRIEPCSASRSEIDEDMLCRLETSRSTPSHPISSYPPSSPKLGKLERSKTVEECYPKKKPHKTNKPSFGSQPNREGSARKDVRILAWQFFNILPWHRKNSAPTRVETQAEIEKAAPTLAICLKRYGFKDGQPYRKDTPIDIPEEMLLPYPTDSDMIDNHFQAQEFKLVLIAVVCHRGKSLNEGHYTTLVRRSPPTVDGDSNSSRRLSDASQPPNYSEDQWFKFDDLADPRVFPVSFQEAIFEEMPYLLFYQVQPRLLPLYNASECTKSDQEPPSYDSGLALTISVSHPSEENESSNTSYVECINSQTSFPRDEEQQDFFSPKKISDIPPSIVNDSLAQPQVTVLSLEASPEIITSGESTKNRFSRAAAKFSKNNLRPPSQSGEKRIGVTINRLNIMRSKELLIKLDQSKERQNSDDVSEGLFVLPSEDLVLSPGDENDNQPKKKKKKPPKFRRGETDGLAEKSEPKEPDRECIIM